MAIETTETYLCLLDNLELKADVTLDEFSIRRLTAKDLTAVLRESDGPHLHEDYQRRAEVYVHYPWALQQTVTHSDDGFAAGLRAYQLAYAHAREASWYPFQDLVRTLNLMKQSSGPILPRHFYHKVLYNTEGTARVEAVRTSEPYQIECADGTITPSEYVLSPGDQPRFHELRRQLADCLSNQANSHFEIAVHYFENGDTRLTPQPLPRSFKAIDPLMSYDACLEALVIRETERDVKALLSKRISRIIGANLNEVENFVKRVFWLRSKTAHGARSVYEIEHLIVYRPNDEISDSGSPVPAGGYDHILLRSGFFPGFLVNLREVCRLSILYFCDKHAAGESRDDILNGL